MHVCVQAGVPHLLRSVLHTVTLDCVRPGIVHRALGRLDWLTGGFMLILGDKGADRSSERKRQE